MRETEPDLAHRVEPGHVLGSELELEAAEVVVELGARLRSDERHDHAGLLTHPVERDLCGVRPIFSATWITSAAIARARSLIPGRAARRAPRYRHSRLCCR